MSVTVRHLNADSSFHLIFSPEPHPKPCDLRSANGAYSVLVDPWLVGSSVTTAPWFAITNRVVPSCIQHLSELDDEPDMVICSQNKADHTNKDTLLQLRPEGKTTIVAEPAAAKAIKSWKHFDPNRVHGMTKYDPKAKFGNSLRLYIPPLSPDGDAGEINITFIPAKNYMTGLHNAFGITYQAPTHIRSLAPVSTINLSKARYFHSPTSPVSITPSSPTRWNSPVTQSASTFDVKYDDVLPTETLSDAWSRGHRPQLSRSINTASSELLSSINQPTLRPSQEHLRHTRKRSSGQIPSISFDGVSPIEPFSFKLPTPPASPQSAPSSAGSLSSATFSHKDSMSSVSSTSASASHRMSTSNKPLGFRPARPKAMSVLYMPHGMSFNDLKPYVQNHLIRLPGALPLSLLLHSFNYTQNPWYLGGNIMTGAAGGMDIARGLMARCWISAHDELKDDRGVAVKKLKLQQTQAEEIRRELLDSADNRSSGWVCDVRSLGVGKEILLSGDIRDMCAGFDTTISADVSNANLLQTPRIGVAG